MWSFLHFLSWLHFYAGSFSYTSRADFFYIFLSGEFLLHIPCLFDFSVGSFSYTSRAGFIFMRGISLERPVVALFLSGESLLHIPCLLFISVGSLSYTSWAGSLPPPPPPPPPAGFIFYAGSFSYIPCWLLIYLFISGSFSYTSSAGFIFLWGVSLTHPRLVWCFCGEFLLHIPWLLFFLSFFLLF